MRHVPSAATYVALVSVASLFVPAHAADPWWVPRLREKQVTASDAQMQQDEVPSVPATGAAPAGTAAAASVAPSAAAPAAPTPLPNESLRKIGMRLREGPIGREPNSIAYLDLIDAGKATPAQVNDFAAYLAKRGMPRVALAYQEYAVKLSENDPTLWLNLGTIQRTIGNMGAAESAFKKCIAIDPNLALAHYNLGAVYDAEKQYDDAIESYRRALVLDPELADPRKNPQVVNNENLLAVKLQIYQNQSGSLGLPLLQMQKPAEGDKAAPAPKK